MAIRLTQAEREELLCTCIPRDGQHRALCNTQQGVTMMMDNERLVAAVERIVEDRVAQAAPKVRRAILDPGSILKRGPDYDGEPYGERLDQWQARAIQAILAGD